MKTTLRLETSLGGATAIVEQRIQNPSVAISGGLVRDISCIPDTFKICYLRY